MRYQILHVERESYNAAKCGPRTEMGSMILDYESVVVGEVSDDPNMNLRQTALKRFPPPDGWFVTWRKIEE